MEKTHKERGYIEPRHCASPSTRSKNLRAKAATLHTILLVEPATQNIFGPVQTTKVLTMNGLQGLNVTPCPYCTLCADVPFRPRALMFQIPLKLYSRYLYLDLLNHIERSMAQFCPIADGSKLQHEKLMPAWPKMEQHQGLGMKQACIHYRRLQTPRMQHPGFSDKHPGSSIAQRRVHYKWQAA
eukprot:1154574-Pelagomonas_calceolata.AAC.1